VKSLRSAFTILTENKIQVTGVSMDTIAEQRSFSDKFDIPFSLLCDTTGVICEAYRIEHPKSKPRRETFLFRNGSFGAPRSSRESDVSGARCNYQYQ
jgi:peroxiredoxin